MNLKRLTPAVLSVLLIGCTNQEEQYLNIMADQQYNWQYLGDTLEKVKDAPSMAATKVELEQRLEYCDMIAKKTRELPKPPAEFFQKHDQKVYLIKRAMERVQDEVKRIQKDVPGGAGFLRQFQSQHPGLLSAVQP